MSSIRKRALRPFCLLSLAIFVSSIASALLILSWKVLVTWPSSLNIAAGALEKIKKLSTNTRLDYTSCPLEKAIAYQNRSKKTYSIIQETSRRCCFADKKTPSINVFCVRIKPVYLNPTLRITHILTYCNNVTPGGI
jgi:hypothetical protein